MKIPKLRSGSYFPPFLEPRRTAEKALAAVIQENESAITRLVGALLQRRYMQLEGLQQLTDNQPARLSAVMS